MSDERQKRLAQLRQAYESGILDEDTYLAAVAALDPTPEQPAPNIVERAVNIGRDVGGHVITGDGNVVVTSQAETPAQKLAQARQHYLRNLIRHCNVLPLASMGEDEGFADEIGLDKVYIALDTQSTIRLTDEDKKPQRENKEDRPLTALEAAGQQRRLVLLGDPGSGKSSFVRQLVAWLAAAALGLRELPPGWSATTPFLTTLRALANRLVKLDLQGLAKEERAQKLQAAVMAQWQADFAALRVPQLADHLDALLEMPLLLIFDGLDEVAIQARQLVREAVGVTLQSYGRQARVIVTCRIRSYSGSTILPNFASERLAPFDQDKIRHFVKGWYDAQSDRLSPQEVAQKSDDLTTVATGHLQELANNPMLLTTMAIIHQREVGLPKERVRLYNLAVDVLIRRWQTGRGIPVSPTLAALLEDDLRLRRILDRLGYEAHRLQGEKGAAIDLSRLDILGLLEEDMYLGDIGLAAEFLDYVDQRAGLLVGQGGEADDRKPLTYSFPHRTFQEYLAGCYLVTGRVYIRRYWQRVEAGDYYYLAAQLGSEELLYNNRQGSELFLDLAYALCPERAPQTEIDWRALVWSGRMATLLPRAQIEADATPEGGAAYLQRLIPRLVDLLKMAALSPLERAEAGRVLGLLGDPRAGVCTLEPDLIAIPAGIFLMGEKPDKITLEAFAIARYPVTNAQFQMFVEDGGYTEKWRGCWTEAGWAWKGNRESPDDYGTQFNGTNQPVVGVGWYEAVAYGRWLAAKTDKPYQLPTETQWERAARHTDSRTYPWGETTPTPESANFEETNLQRTTVVGSFPQDKTEGGVQDIAGNINEWCQTRWHDESGKDYQMPYQPEDGREELEGDDSIWRVWKGGSYFDDGSWLRCAYRSWYYPDGWDYYLGFRVCVSPFSIPLGSEPSDL